MAIPNSVPTTLALAALGIAVAVAGYVWIDQQTSVRPQVGELRADLSVKGSELAALTARMEELAGSRRRMDDELNRLAERVSQATEALGALPDRIDEIEKTMDRFVGVGDKSRTSWLLAEAEHYMRIANAQLGIAADVDVAQTALGLADNTLRELNDPRFIPVRKLLTEEITALKAVPRADTEGIVLSLGSLSETLDRLPLKSSAPRAYRAAPEKPGAPLTGFDRAVAATRAALASLVRIRQVDDPVSPLLSEAEQTVVVRSLDLELQLARLAIMRGDAGMYRRSIDAATDRVREDFDPSSADVQSVLETLNDLSEARLPEELPDISGSLVALLKITGEMAAAAPRARQ